MSQERLTGLDMPSIEASSAKVMDVHKLIDRFAEMKTQSQNIS